MRKKVNWILDIRSFFDEIRHDWLLKFVKHRIADRRILRLIGKWLRAGVSEEGQWSKTERGTPQGSVASPLLANVYPSLRLRSMGSALAATSGDRRDNRRPIRRRCCVGISAPRRRRAVPPRLEGTARPVRTKAAPGQDATDRVRALCSRQPKRAWSREAGDVQLPRIHPHLWANVEVRQVPRSTQDHPQRLSAKLRALKEELRRRKHLSLAELGKWLRSVVQGYFNYHAVPGNLASLRSFRLQVIRRWLRALQRRSQKDRMTWPRLMAIAERWLPKPSILHPYPNLRFDATHPR